MRVTRYSPMGVRSREQSLAELDDEQLTELFRASQPGARSPGRLPLVTASPTAPAAFVDLQVHSTASDGALSPAAVVQAAADAALYAIALTDHDSVEGLAEAREAGERLGVRIVPGVELSTHFEGEELHLLGLHLSNLDAMRDALEEFREQRVERARRIVATLNAHSIPVTMEAVLAEAGPGAVGRPHIARAMLAGGWVREFREAFDKWIGWGARPTWRRSSSMSPMPSRWCTVPVGWPYGHTPVNSRRRRALAGSPSAVSTRLKCSTPAIRRIL